MHPAIINRTPGGGFGNRVTPGGLGIYSFSLRVVQAIDTLGGDATRRKGG